MGAREKGRLPRGRGMEAGRHGGRRGPSHVMWRGRQARARGKPPAPAAWAYVHASSGGRPCRRPRRHGPCREPPRQVSGTPQCGASRHRGGPRRSGGRRSPNRRPSPQRRPRRRPRWACRAANRRWSQRPQPAWPVRRTGQGPDRRRLWRPCRPLPHPVAPPVASCPVSTTPPPASPLCRRGGLRGVGSGGAAVRREPSMSEWAGMGGGRHPPPLPTPPCRPAHRRHQRRRWEPGPAKRRPPPPPQGGNAQQGGKREETTNRRARRAVDTPSPAQWDPSSSGGRYCQARHRKTTQHGRGQPSKER